METYDLSMELSAEISKLKSLRKSLSFNFERSVDHFRALVSLFDIGFRLMSFSTRLIEQNTFKLLKAAFDEIEISHNIISESETGVQLRILKVLIHIDISISILKNCIYLNKA